MYKKSQNPKEIRALCNFMRDRMAQGSLKSYLEIGSYAGESLDYIVSIMSKDAKVVLVDLGDNSSARTELLKKIEAYNNSDYLKLDIHLITGDSKNAFIVDKVRELCPPRAYDLCFIDGCHDFEYVASDLENYGPMSSYVAMHDIDPRCIPKQVEKHWYEKPCAAHVWRVLKLSRQVDEFIDKESDRPMGIGVLRGITIGR